jgi:hypothetical protein
MCSMVSLAESIAFAAISVDKNGPKALVFMRAVAEGHQPKCPREYFRGVCHCLIQSAPFYTEYLAKLAQTLEDNKSLSPLREILRTEISAQMPTLRDRMYQTTQMIMIKYPNPRLHREDGWINYLKGCLQYPALGQLMGEVALDVFGLPESDEHRLRSQKGVVRDTEQGWRDRVLECALAAMKTGGERAAPLPHDEGSSPVRDLSPAFA